VSNYCVETKLEADAELIRTALFLAFNLLYQPAATRAAVGGGQEIDARLPNRAQRRGRRRSLVSAPLPRRGVQLVHGDAVYPGPTFFWKIAPKVLMSAAWEAQIAGREIGASAPRST
jgi:hypothetical protein